MKKNLLLFTIGILSLAACDKHTHTYSQAYVFDENNHWKQAICEHKELFIDKGPHSFSEFKVINEPTTTKEGKKSAKCTVCGYEKIETIDKIVIRHEHTFFSEWSKDNTYHWHAATCEHTDVKGDLNPHDYNDWVIDDEATTTETGLKHRICKVCGYTQSEVIPVHVHTFDTTKWEKDSFTHWNPSTCGHDVKGNEGAHNFGPWNVVTPATTTSEGLERRTCSICSYAEESTIEKITTNNSGSFTLYTFNDFHGAVNEYPSDNHIGLAKFGTYLKNVSKQDNVMIIDSGDTYQGSIESNWNYGAMITDVFNYAHVDVHTLGNHDFDWGESKIESNKARSYTDGWSMTNLGANIYDYDFSSKYEGDIQQTRLGDKYYIKTMKNGLKVGVIGVIGRDQITSICSPLVEDICFKAHIQILKDLSDELRVYKGVDVVIASIHDSAENSMNNGLSSISPGSNKKYFDYVACAHSHYNENYVENGTPYTQAAAYGKYIYKADFTVNTGNVTNCDVTCLDYYDVTNAVSTINPNINSIIANYSPAYSSVGNEVIAPSVSGKFYKNSTLPNLLCKAMYLEAENEGYNVDLSFCNEARYDIDQPSWTYSTIYEAFPFDNVIYVVKIKGEKNLKEVCNYSYRYHDSSLTSVNSNTWYTVAVIDYLLFHTNDTRDYNYFSHNPNYMQVLGTLKKSNGENYLYRDILADYLRGQSGTLSYNNYLSSGSNFNKPSVN